MGNDLLNNHLRLSIALTDCAYVLSRAAVRAFIPIVKYLSDASNKFEGEKEHKLKLQSACREAGRKLAIDYFSLPKTLRRTTWYCDKTTTKLILQLAKQTINGLGCLIASFAQQWTPKDAESASQTFVEALKGPLNAFLNDRVAAWLSVTRRSMQDMISEKLFSTIGSVVEELTSKLDELISALPAPLCDFLKVGALINYMFNKLCMNAIVFGVKKLALPTEKLLYLADDAEDKCKEMDEQLCRSLRWAPVIRNDEISFEPEKGDDDDEEEDAENVGGDDAEVPDSPSPEDADDDAKEEE